MKKLLLLLSVVLGAMPMFTSMAQDEVTENFGNWFQPTSKPSNADETRNHSEATDITYISSYTYWNNGGSAILIGYNGSTKGYLKFSLPYNVSKITIHTGKQISSSAKINFVAGETTISDNLAIGTQSHNYSIEIPERLQASGTVYKIEIPSTVSKNTQIASITYTKSSTTTSGLGTLTATCNGKDVNTSLKIEEGTPITFHADNATSFDVTVDSQTINLPASNGLATWTPAACNNTEVSVTATDGTNVSEPLKFTLTVTPKKLGELTATYNNAPISSPLSIEQGSEILFHADNATSFSVTVDGEADPIELPATDGSATWTPSVCTDANVSVIAIRNVEGQPQQQTETPLVFTLTVTKVAYVIADWVVTGITGTAGGSKLDEPLICAEGSANGIWTAFHKTAYSATTDNCAQLGSSNADNTFNGGTLTLTNSDIPQNAKILSVTLTGYNHNSIAAVWSIAVGSQTATENITFSQTSEAHTANVNLTGNSIVLTCNAATENGNIKQTYISGISIKYTIPEPKPEPDPITISYTPQFCFDASEIDGETDLMLMAGTELTFTSINATTMEITSAAEIANLLETVAGENIKWAPEAGEYTITVTASNEQGSKQSNYYIYTEEITPTIPEIITEGNSAMVTCDNGALMIKIEDYVAPSENTPSMLAADVQDWTFSPEETQGYSLDCSDLAEGRTIALSAKAVTPKTESKVVTMYFNNQGVVAGIENVAVDAENGEAIYYDLQGRRVNADRPGMYIRQQGAKAEKVVIR